MFPPYGHSGYVVLVVDSDLAKWSVADGNARGGIA